MSRKYTFIDLFAGCGGLSEGFIQAGFEPLVHVEKDKAACYSLRTRMAFHYLRKNKKSKVYKDYLNGDINRVKFYKSVPSNVIDSVINEEIDEINLKQIFMKIDTIIGETKLDLIIGGPPCQAYSLVGRARQINGMLGDKRNWLFKFYVEFLKKYKPAHFVFENVKGLLSAKDENGIKYYDLMMQAFFEAGYIVPKPQIVSADEYGVPQSRQRVIIVGTRNDLKPIELRLQSQELKTTIAHIFKDLPEIKSGDMTHNIVKAKRGCNALYNLGLKDSFPITFHKSRQNNAQDLKIYQIAVEKWNSGGNRLNYNDLPSKLQTHKNKSAFTDRFKVVAGNLKSSHTVVAHLAKDGHYYIHPDIEQNRSISPREAARLQTFPDNYYFESVTGEECLSSAFRQIGNAVPVYLAKQIAKSIKKDLKNE